MGAMPVGKRNGSAETCLFGERKPKLVYMAVLRRLAAASLLLATLTGTAAAQSIDVTQRLQGFDDYMAKTLKDWNAPGVGVGIVVNDKLVLAKGYGYRDYGKKLPYTPRTMSPIASNTKLFTAVAAGMLVQEGKLTWDKPVRDSVLAIRFYNDQLNDSVTLRDMLSHRTGITRHDTIWYKSDFTRKELFQKLVYLEPEEPLRTTFLYNNLMFAAVGYLIELQSGKTWEQFVRERIFNPLDMNSTSFSIADMLKQPEFGVGYTERRDSFEIYRIPYYEDIAGVAPCGAIVSNIEDMSHWLIALMNDGKYNGKQVLPPEVLKATLQPAIALPNVGLETRGWTEILNAAYRMGRETASYRGHLITFHGGDLPGFHTQVSFMPEDHIGVIVFEIGNHSQPLYNIVSYTVYERLLGMDLTPWSERQLKIRLENKKAGTEARTKANEGRVPNTQASHPLQDYVGAYENPAYGVMNIGLKDNQLQFDFHKMKFPMTRFHYDRFDTPDDEQDGKWSVNFRTNPQGDVDQAVMSLDEAEAVFTRKPETIDPKLMAQMAGSYQTPSGSTFQIALTPGDGLSLVLPGQPILPLKQTKGLAFRTPQFSDLVFEFVVQDGQVKALKQRDPSGETTFPKK
ncbi:MAG TPA: serine hydrolase [Terriglobia bacterium]|nr:serine hydrolase [Terriglobia bacterium]